MALSEWLPVVGWSIPALGWYIANTQANQRELRKEVRAEIEDVSSLVEKILEAYKKYLALSGGDKDALGLSLEIQYAFNRLDAQLELLTLRRHYSYDEFAREQLLDMSEVIGVSTEFFDSCTGGNFGEKDKPALDGDVLAAAWLRSSLLGHRLIQLLSTQFVYAFK